MFIEYIDIFRKFAIVFIFYLFIELLFPEGCIYFRTSSFDLELDYLNEDMIIFHERQCRHFEIRKALFFGEFC